MAVYDGSVRCWDDIDDYWPVCRDHYTDDKWLVCRDPEAGAVWPHCNYHQSQLRSSSVSAAGVGVNGRHAQVVGHEWRR